MSLVEVGSLEVTLVLCGISFVHICACLFERAVFSTYHVQIHKVGFLSYVLLSKKRVQGMCLFTASHRLQWLWFFTAPDRQKWSSSSRCFWHIQYFLRLLLYFIHYYTCIFKSIKLLHFLLSRRLVFIVVMMMTMYFLLFSSSSSFSPVWSRLGHL